MKIVDILGGMKVPISEEEYLVLEQIRREKIYKKNLEERTQELATRLVTRGVLVRHKDKKGIYYSYNDLQDVWRN